MSIIAEGRAAVKKDGVLRIISRNRLNDYVDHRGYVEVSEKEMQARYDADNPKKEAATK